MYITDILLNSISLPTKLEVGKHLYWNLGRFSLHGQVVIVTCTIVVFIILVSFLITYRLNLIPHYWQNFIEYILEFLINIIKDQLGENNYKEWIPFISTLFIFILGCNWIGIIIPWKLIKLPKGELSSPTNDINTTVALALLTSIAYFYAGLNKKGINYFKRYIYPIPFLFPIIILEDITKPLSLSFRLFGNIIADDLTISVLTRLVPILIPLPIMLLSIFTGLIQALIFSTLAVSYIAEALE